MTFFIKMYYYHSIHTAQSKHSFHLKIRILVYLRVKILTQLPDIDGDRISAHVYGYLDCKFDTKSKIKSSSFKCLSNSETKLSPSKGNFPSKESNSLIRTVF